MNKKELEKIHKTILNFILYYTSDDKEREKINEVLEDYLVELKNEI